MKLPKFTTSPQWMMIGGLYVCIGVLTTFIILRDSPERRAVRMSEAWLEYTETVAAAACKGGSADDVECVVTKSNGKSVTLACTIGEYFCQPVVK